MQGASCCLQKYSNFINQEQGIFISCLCRPCGNFNLGYTSNTSDTMQHSVSWNATVFSARVVMVTTVRQLDPAIKVMQISGTRTVHVYHDSNTLYICIYLLPMSHFLPLLPLPVHHHLNEHTKYLDSDHPDIRS
jgi:hypothetical protein